MEALLTLGIGLGLISFFGMLEHIKLMEEMQSQIIDPTDNEIIY